MEHFEIAATGALTWLELRGSEMLGVCTWGSSLKQVIVSSKQLLAYCYEAGI